MQNTKNSNYSMFAYSINPQTDSDDGTCIRPGLAFARSIDVKAYPCGTRRGAKVTTTTRGGQSQVESIKYIPFDPEARLSTEFNNRRVIGVNGRSATYVENWVPPRTVKNHSTGNEVNVAGNLALVLDGYQFSIKHEYSSVTALVDDLLGLENLEIEEASQVKNIYANIRLEAAPLYTSDVGEYSTLILRNQTNDGEDGAEVGSAPLTSIDLSIPNTDVKDIENAYYYYFSGLSFSTEPLTNKTQQLTSSYAGYDYTVDTHTRVDIYNTDGELFQQVISLCIFVRDREKVSGVWQYKDTWKVNPEALLPYIERCGSHVDHTNNYECNSRGGVLVGDLVADDITASDAKIDGINAGRIYVDEILQKYPDTENTRKIYALTTEPVTYYTDKVPSGKTVFKLKFSSTYNKEQPEEEETTPETPETPAE